MTVLMIAYDGSPNARRAVAYAARFLTAERAVLLTVWEPMRAGNDAVSIDLDGPPDALEDEDLDIAFADAQHTNDHGVALARAAGLKVEPMCVAVGGSVWRTIIEAADRLDADLVVTGTRGTTGVRSLLQPSVADRVLRHGGRPVLIIPPAP